MLFIKAILATAALFCWIAIGFFGAIVAATSILKCSEHIQHIVGPPMDSAILLTTLPLMFGSLAVVAGLAVGGFLLTLKILGGK